MTRLGPPKLAPPDVPPHAAHYLDNAAEYLTELVKAYGLTLKPYERRPSDRGVWHHGLYGTSRDREYCVQLVTDENMAPSFTALLNGYVRLYPSDGTAPWLLLERRQVNGMAALMTDAAAVADALRMACVWRMPHPTDPDPKN